MFYKLKVKFNFGIARAYTNQQKKKYIYRYKTTRVAPWIPPNKREVKAKYLESKKKHNIIIMGYNSNYYIIKISVESR